MCCDNVKPAYRPVIGCGVGMLVVILGALGISIYNIEAIRHLQDEMKNKNQVVYLNSNTTNPSSKSILYSSKKLSEIVPLDTKNVATVSNSLPYVSSSFSSSVNNTLLYDTNSSLHLNSSYLVWTNSTVKVNTSEYISNYTYDLKNSNIAHLNIKPLQRIIKINKLSLVNNQNLTTNLTTYAKNNSDESDEFNTVFCNGIRVSENTLPSSNIEVEYYDDHLIITCNHRKTRILKSKKPNTVVFLNGKKVLTQKVNKPSSVHKLEPTSKKQTSKKPTNVKLVSRVTELKRTSAKPIRAKPTSVKPVSRVTELKRTSAKPTSVKPVSRVTELKPTSAKPTNVKLVSRVTELKPTSAKPTSAKPTSAIRIIAQSSNFKSKQKTLTQTSNPKAVLSYKSKNKIIKMLPALKYLSNYAREKPIINIKLIKKTSSKLDDIFEYDDEYEECNDSFEDCDD